MPSDSDTQAILEEATALLNKAVELLNKIKDNNYTIKVQNSGKHKWEKKFRSNLMCEGGAHWWQCETCGLTPTSVKPLLINEDKPLDTECPGPAIFKENSSFKT